MNNYVSIKETNNGFIVSLNDYSTNATFKGTWVARSVEELSSILEKNVYPAFMQPEKKQ